MSHHLTYLEAVVTGLVQGVTELFPVSSLGHNVLIPALLGGSWAKTLNVSDSNSPYLAFVVGLHVATAIAMIAYFWRDWLRIVRGFFSSLRNRSVSTPDERLAWMIILATIPVGIVGAALQKEFVKVFAKPELAAAFLAVNGVILLVSERMRRSRDDAKAARVPVAAGGQVLSGGPVSSGAPGRLDGDPQGYAQRQQPWQQQWQGPDPRYGEEQPGQDGYGRAPWDGPAAAPGGGDPRYAGDPRYGQPQPGQAPQYGQQPEYGSSPSTAAAAAQYGQAPQYGQQPQYGRQPHYGQPQYGQQPQNGQPAVRPAPVRPAPVRAGAAGAPRPSRGWAAGRRAWRGRGRGERPPRRTAARRTAQRRPTPRWPRTGGCPPWGSAGPSSSALRRSWRCCPASAAMASSPWPACRAGSAGRTRCGTPSCCPRRSSWRRAH